MPTVLSVLDMLLFPLFNSSHRALVSQESVSFATVKSAKRRGRLVQRADESGRRHRSRGRRSRLVALSSSSLSSRPHRFRNGASSAKLKTFTSAKETWSCGRPSHKPGHISRGHRGECRGTSKKPAKAERVWGERGIPPRPHLGCTRGSCHPPLWTKRSRVKTKGEREREKEREREREKKSGTARLA